MKLKRILSIILTISIIATRFSSVAQISAQTDEESPSQAAQIAGMINKNVQTNERPNEPTEDLVISSENDFAKFMNTPEFWESNYKVTLACDIDMKGKAYNPIKEFSGIFDGCGYVVSNLKVQNKLNKSKNSELAFINNLNQFAEIKNITFNNYTIEGKSDIKRAAGLIITNKGIVFLLIL